MMGVQKRTKQALLLSIRTEDILPNPNQPRRYFDSAELVSLAESIRHNGVIQPLTVRKIEAGRYELIAGERRLRASKMIGLPTVPCVLSDVSDEKSAILALIENLQRQDLNFFEEALAISKLMEAHGMSQEKVAQQLGKAQSTLSNKLRLLKLTPETRRRISEANLTERHARALLRIEEPSLRSKALETMIAKDLNVASADALVTQLLENNNSTKKQVLPLVRDVRLFVNTINHAVDIMRKSGIDADARRDETDAYLTFTVRVPKNAALRPMTNKRAG
jgi:ParB family chromosome partitioning protein